MITFAVLCKLTARELYPSPSHAMMTSFCSALARSCKVGNCAVNLSRYFPTLEICVCCDITSMSRTWYSFVVCRHGKSRLFSWYHSARFMLRMQTGRYKRIFKPQYYHDTMNVRLIYGIKFLNNLISFSCTSIIPRERTVHADKRYYFFRSVPLCKLSWNFPRV